jgi:hypothetical protein
MADWLRGFITAIFLVVSLAVPLAAQADNLRVGFINPMQPPEFW